MLANSFTKALPANKWAQFLGQIGLAERIKSGEITATRLKEIQSQIEKLEVEQA
jgi:hypothetical protein